MSLTCFYCQEFWKKLGDLGLLGVTAPGKLKLAENLH